MLLKGREIAYHLNDSQAKAYFCFQGTAELPMGAEGKAGFDQVDGCEHFFLITADPAAASPIEGAETMGRALAGQPPVFEPVLSAETDPAVILYTSGTTGQAKGAELSHSNLLLNALTCNRLFGTKPGTDTHLLVLPLFHSFGSTVNMNAGFATAATLVLLPRFDAAAAVKLLETENVTFFAGVPTMYWGLLNALSDGVDVERIAGNMRVARGRRVEPAGGDHQGGQGTLRRPDPRGVRPVRDVPGGHVLRPEQRPAARARSASRSGASR